MGSRNIFVIAAAVVVVVFAIALGAVIILTCQYILEQNARQQGAIASLIAFAALVAMFCFGLIGVKKMTK